MTPNMQRRMKTGHSCARAHARGFGLLEALVAMVVIGTTGLAVFGWINTNLDAAVRLRERDANHHHEAAALGLAQAINPLKQGDGEAELGPGLRVRWRARPLTPLTMVAPLPGGTSTPHRVQLFELELQIFEGDNPRPVLLSVTRMGSERDPDKPSEAIIR